MKAIKGRFEAGEIKLAEPAPAGGPVDVLVVFPEGDEVWEGILTDPTPRPALQKWAREVRAEVEQGKAEPLDPDQL